MPSDLEKLLLGLVSAAEGYQGRRQSNRELLLRMSDRELAQRKELREARRSRLQEFEDLGAPLDVIERGERMRPPTTHQTPGGDVTVGQDFSPRDRADREAYDSYLGRLQGKERDASALFDPATRELIQVPHGTKILPAERGSLTASSLLQIHRELRNRLNNPLERARLTPAQVEELPGRIAEVEDELARRGAPGFRRSQAPPAAPPPSAQPSAKKVRVKLRDGRIGTVPRENLERLKREFGAVEVD